MFDVIIEKILDLILVLIGIEVLNKFVVNIGLLLFLFLIIIVRCVRLFSEGFLVFFVFIMIICCFINFLFSILVVFK